MAKDSPTADNDVLLPTTNNYSEEIPNPRKKRSNRQKRKKTGVFIAALTIVNTIIGGGIVAMPWASHKVGLLVNVIFSIACVLISQFSITLLIKAKNLSGYSSYTEIGFKAFGRSSIFVINFAIAVAYLGTPISYFIIFTDSATLLLAHTGLQSDFFLRRRQVIIAILAVLLLYFALKKQIAEIKIASILAFSAVSVFVIFLIVQISTGKTENDDDKHDYWFQPASIDIFSAIPVILLAYGFQPSFYPVYEALQQKNDRNGNILTITALTIVFVVYTIVSFIGVYAYGTALSDNILKNLDGDSNVFSYMLLIFFMVISAMHIPVIFYLGKESILITVDQIRNKSISAEQTRKIEVAIKESMIRDSMLRDQRARTTSALYDEMGHPIHQDNSRHQSHMSTHSEKAPAYQTMGNWWYYPITIICWLFIVGIALLNPDLSLILGIIGATAVSILCYMLPGAFYVALSAGRSTEPTWMKVVGWMYVIVGFVILVGCNFCTIYVAVK